MGIVWQQRTRGAEWHLTVERSTVGSGRRDDMVSTEAIVTRNQTCVACSVRTGSTTRSTGATFRYFEVGSYGHASRAIRERNDDGRWWRVQ